MILLQGASSLSLSLSLSRQERTSYIMFQHFAASITKQILTSVEVFVSKNLITTQLSHTLNLPQSNSGALLQNEDFTVDGATGLQSNSSLKL